MNAVFHMQDIILKATTTIDKMGKIKNLDKGCIVKMTGGALSIRGKNRGQEPEEP
jgi:hypothetical protein